VPAAPSRFAPLATFASCSLTFPRGSVVRLGGFFFRSDSLATGDRHPSPRWRTTPRIVVAGQDGITNLLLIALLCGPSALGSRPNTQTLMRYDHEKPHRRQRAPVNLGAAAPPPPLTYPQPAVACLRAILGIQQHSEFIYFRVLMNVSPRRGFAATVVREAAGGSC